MFKYGKRDRKKDYYPGSKISNEFREVNRKSTNSKKEKN